MVLAEAGGFATLWNGYPSGPGIAACLLPWEIEPPARALWASAMVIGWPGFSGAPMGDLLRWSDRGALALLGSLLVALADGPDAVDRWLAEHGARRGDL